MAADTSKYEKIIEAVKAAVKKIYMDAAINGELLPVSDKDGNVIYIDPKKVLNK